MWHTWFDLWPHFTIDSWTEINNRLIHDEVDTCSLLVYKYTVCIHPVVKLLCDTTMWLRRWSVSTKLSLSRNKTHEHEGTYLRLHRAHIWPLWKKPGGWTTAPVSSGTLSSTCRGEAGVDQNSSDWLHAAFKKCQYLQNICTPVTSQKTSRKVKNIYIYIFTECV